MFSVNIVFFVDIVDFMKKQVGDPSTLKEKLSDVKNAMLKEDVTIVGFFKGEEDTVYKTYQTACTYIHFHLVIRADWCYAHCHDEYYSHENCEMKVLRYNIHFANLLAVVWRT